MKYFATLLLCMLSSLSYAEEGFPKGCQPVSVLDTPLILKTTKPPVLALVHNLSNSEVWVTHPVADPGASAGWSSKLQGGNWSAMALQNDTFELNCIESRPGHEQQVPCAGVLAICLWQATKMPAGEGTYWAGEDMSLAALTAHLGGRGFVLPTTQ
jgi:hypothetical protein